jgi:hypothetical protein
MSNADPEERPDSLSRDVAFEILTNARRRYALAYLRSQDEEVSIGELAEAVAAWEHDTSVEMVSSKERKSVYTSLYQTHLPKMADAGVVAYDRQRGVVTLAAGATDLDSFRAPNSRVPNWSRYYLALAVASGVVVGCRLLGMYPFTEMSILAYATLVLGSFVMLSVANLGMAWKNGRQ